ncbi:hypothetical protein GQ457_04G000650 [Hibiscus cannabinus]
MQSGDWHSRYLNLNESTPMRQLILGLLILSSCHHHKGILTNNGLGFVSSINIYVVVNFLSPSEEAANGFPFIKFKFQWRNNTYITLPIIVVNVDDGDTHVL